MHELCNPDGYALCVESSLNDSVSVIFWSVTGVMYFFSFTDNNYLRTAYFQDFT